MFRDRIVEIATEIRRRADGRVKRELPESPFGEDLNGFCAIGAFWLFMALTQEGFSPEIVVNRSDSHCFVECEGYVVDITATQFNGPEVLVSRPEDIKHPDRESLWGARKRFDAFTDFLDFLEWNDWPDQQVPTIRESVKWD